MIASDPASDPAAGPVPVATSDPVPAPASASPAELRAFLLAQLADPDNEWSTGTFGALAEFSRDAHEPFTLREHADRLELSTAHGALRLMLHPLLRAIAYETLGADGGWQHGVALCLPAEAAAMAGRRAITGLGPDDDAIDAADRDAMLVDLGFGCTTADLCIRSTDADLLAAVRSHEGQAPLGEALPLIARMADLSPQRVFATRAARVEVRRPIPPPDGVTPTGPHTHVLPQLMREGRTHAATLPIPAGWVPCATLHPPVAIRRSADGGVAVDAAVHARSQALVARWGLPELQAIKQAALAALDSGAAALPVVSSATLDRHARTTLRVAVRQWRALRTGAGRDARLPAWAAELAPSG